MDREAEVRRLLERYLVEIVEAYDLCPWARAARLGGEIAIEIVWGMPPVDAWVAAASQLLARPGVRVAMVVAPEWNGPLPRDAVAARLPTAGVADFHPGASLDLATPARLVPFLRRSPDPMLQLVPLAILDTVRAPPPALDLAHQAQILGGHAVAVRGDVADRLAATNHARVLVDRAAIVAKLDDIAADRRRSYARVGISTSH